MTQESAKNSKSRTDQPLLLASFFITNEAALVELKKQWSYRSKDHKKMLGRARTDVETLRSLNFGGSVALLDPTDFSRGIHAEIHVPLAFGMCVSTEERALYVASGNALAKIQHGQRTSTFDNPLFNDLHGLSRSLDGTLLVCSTGTDTLLELDLGNPNSVLWDWLATENGFAVRGDGKVRTVNRSENYQDQVTTTPEHTTHINSSLNHRPGKILATLFHQGELVEIDYQTKRSRTVLGGLQSPHGIRRRSEGYLVCDTRGNRLLLLKEDLSLEREIHLHGFDWVQDAIEIRSLDGYLIADSNNGKLVLVGEDGEERSRFEYSKNSRKIASLELISKHQAEFIFGNTLR